MPRIYDMENIPMDYCRNCFSEAIDLFKEEVAAAGEEWKEWEGNVDCDHPEYEDTTYDCELCGIKLTERDDQRIKSFKER